MGGDQPSEGRRALVRLLRVLFAAMQATLNLQDEDVAIPAVSEPGAQILLAPAGSLTLSSNT